jgi:hypothetical protein
MFSPFHPFPLQSTKATLRLHLVETNDAVKVRIEKLARVLPTTTARTAVQKDRRRARWIA